MFAAAPLALTAASVSLSRGTEHDRLTMAAQLAATPGSV